MTRRAFVPDHEHRHFRDDGRGYISHRHAVHSERHSHQALGLAFTLLRWPGFSWRRALGTTVGLGTITVYIGFGVIALVGFWSFARDVKWP